MRNNKSYKQKLITVAMQELISGNRITTPDFMELTGSWRLAACIHLIEQRYGWHISRKVINSTGMVMHYLTTEEFKRVKATEVAASMATVKSTKKENNDD